MTDTTFLQEEQQRVNKKVMKNANDSKLVNQIQKNSLLLI